jgi:hypothetical protein
VGRAAKAAHYFCMHFGDSGPFVLATFRITPTQVGSV